MIKYPVRATRRKKSIQKQQRKEEFKLRKKQIRDSLISKYTDDYGVLMSFIPEKMRLDFMNDYRIAVFNLKEEFGYDR